MRATGSEAMRQVEALGLKPIRLTEAANGARAKAVPGAGPSGPAPSSAAGSAASDGAEDGNGFRSENVAGGKRKITARVLENFTRLLSSLLAAGVPFSRALVILYREATVPAAKEQWKEIHDLVIDGMSLSDAMARSPETFPRVYVAMVEAGETGGFLDVVLAQIADFQAREKDIKIEGGQRPDVSPHFAGPRDGRADLPDGFLHSAFPAHLQELQRRPAAAHPDDRPDEPGGARLRAVRRRGRSWWPSFPCAPGSSPRTAAGHGRA